MDITIHQAMLPHNGPEASLAFYRDTASPLATTDLDGTLERLQAGSGEVVQDPTGQSYGIRGCSFRDPAGNLIRIQEAR